MQKRFQSDVLEHSVNSGYKIVKLTSGVYSVHSFAEGETFHPVIGPVAEAEARSSAHEARFHQWISHAGYPLHGVD